MARLLTGASTHAIRGAEAPDYHAAKTREDAMKERLILAGRLSTAILAAILLAACGTEYTVTFRVGEGSGKPPATKTVTHGDWLTLPDQGAMTAPSGKTFLGWKYSDNSTFYYKAWESVEITGDVVFIAHWE